MAHRRRWLLNTLAIVSLGLFIVTIVFGIRSYWRTDLLIVERYHRWYFGSVAGLFSIARTTDYPVRPSNANATPPQYVFAGSEQAASNSLHFFYSTFPSNGVKPRKGFLGFGIGPFWGTSATTYTSGHAVMQTASTGHGATFPAWFPALLFALLPATRSRTIAKQRRISTRAARGLCINCGYDIRATPTRCPECGQSL